MVLADGGVVCIDEFDKMKTKDRYCLHYFSQLQGWLEVPILHMSRCSADNPLLIKIHSFGLTRSSLALRTIYFARKLSRIISFHPPQQFPSRYFYMFCQPRPESASEDKFSDAWRVAQRSDGRSSTIQVQYTATEGSKVVNGVKLSPRSTKAYFKTSLRCKQESIMRIKNNGTKRSPLEKLPASLTGGDFIEERF